MSLWRALLLALAVLASSTAAQAQQPAGHSLDATDLDAWLDGAIPYALRTGDIAGAVVVVVKNGQLVTARGYGWADIAAHRPVDPERTLFRVGSVSKLFTWTAVMQQVEAGRLDLDADVNRYLDFAIPPYQGKPVTLRQIMTHTAGFEESGKDVITFHAPIALDAYLKRWVPARIYAPGTTPAYSNWATALAGYIVQRVSGLPFAAYVEQRIFAPLDMRHASFRQPLPPALAPWVATGYPRASAPAQGYEVIGPAPAGALAASGLDMAKFMIAHLAQGRGLMAPQTAATMHHSPLDRVDPKSLVPPLDRAELGFLERNLNGREIIGHRGATQNFHTLFQLYINDGVGLFVSFNSAGRDGAAETALDQIGEGFADRYFPAAPVASRVDPKLAREHARAMAGMWMSSRRAETSFLALAMLAGQTKVALTPEGGLSIASLKDASGAPQVWDEVAPFVWQVRRGHERLAAQLVDGRPMRWSVDTLAPAAVFDRAPAAMSADWLLPALGLSLGALALAVLHWPASWFVRRRFRAPSPLGSRSLLAYRALRIASLAALLVLCGWMTLLAMMLSDLDLLSARSDPWLRLLQLSGLLAFTGSVGLAGWNATLAWRERRHWTRRLWSIAMVLAALMLLYTAWQFGLLAMSTNY
ncbi:serine hydrolase domain-containing protein [Sphingomonas sp.]|uniref:serine hydrolase domain-containing protein n=1 Tax=Sphingomonas sp. TaxID=28214 RepID=UPI001B1E12D5|nr:serine hydrolase domain-containing protein [Sphingomonas sp.]MBO9712015.1 beta-lactamase family protein [Sphingomonas sp.]